MYDHRIDGAADIIDRGVADQIDFAGRGIDLDLTDMRAMRKRGDARVDLTGGTKQPAQLRRQAFALSCGARDLEQRDLPVGPRHAKPRLCELDIAGARLET